VIDRELPVAQAHEAFDGDRLADPDLELALSGLLAELVGEEAAALAAA
jgi:hypothetical protein